MIAYIITAVVCISFSAWMIFMAEFNRPNPFTWFNGELTNAEFRALMDLVFNDPAVMFDGYNIIGGGYRCWVANGHFSFSVNDVKNFTPYQRILFFRRYKEWKKDKRIGKVDKLNRAKLAEICFSNQVDSILEEEK